MARLAFAADQRADAFEFLRHALIGGDDLVEGFGDLAGDAFVIAGHADGKVAGAHRLQRLQQFMHFGRGFAVAADGLVGFDGERQFDERAGGFAFALEGLRPGRHKVLHLPNGANRHLAARPRGESFRHESAEPANSASQSQRNKSRLFQYDLDRPARLVLTAALPPGVTWMATNLPNAERPSPFPVA